MRKQIKNKILEEVENAFADHRRIDNIFYQGNSEILQNLLIQCQKRAIWIGNAIEADTPSQSSVIKSLEEYCEEIYALSIQSGDGVTTRLDGYFKTVKEYVEEFISEKIEVVFFPYKASMWDSLESVWMAARDDPDCDAYVVPIPYFDKHPDGTVSAMHYEGNAFPEYVPIVQWEEYNVEMRHPDVIYIHNPYDNGNKVTTVHPDFYAKELKKHTDMLVYIPYFVCMNDAIPPNLCVLPGTMYADKVIVQSEQAREIYIREFHAFEEEYQCAGVFGNAEKKFIALGSPKYDKVLATTKENIEVPQEWLYKILKVDGTRRKVLLYNTSISQLLHSQERFIKKINSVFEQIKNREDTILLWRPHPLSETTYSAMRPQLAAQYHELVRSYRQEDWGIYDDTPDLHRAIALSDAYYGDISSLVELYRLTGKPIMIQNVDVV